MTLLAIILIIALLWLFSPYIKQWAARRMQRELFKRMGIDPDTFQGHEREGHASGHARSRRQNRRRSRKIIPHDYGEYIDFEVFAIVGTESWLDTSASPVYVKYSEMQITEAKYTEIK